jgi:hypothetical protein
MNASCVGLAPKRVAGVVGADCLPGVTHAPEVAREDPRAHFDAGAGVEQSLLLNAVRGELREPGRVDLHETDVARAVPVAPDGAWIEVRFDAGDGVQQAAVDAVTGRGLVPARARRTACEQGEQREADPLTSPRSAQWRVRCDVSLPWTELAAYQPVGGILGGVRWAVWANQDADEAVKSSCKNGRDIDRASHAIGRSAAALPEKSLHGQRLDRWSTVLR